ncbi:1-(5-phosphoribosyl)-5-[(5-phosphoribosylamino)methylideneamino]imidazole-4-carboxamide isomerase [Acidobacteria bacterium AH-259-L09]|nr:1-(5-phosphoribosyl)-5-[(5-phosphoribosylamino)methylideneamino]imidazole-4-carboxamide isomerase [Acidobacteria bacterium AH-259-L09]
MLVIPAIDLVAGKCVRLYQGDFERQMTYEKDPVEQAREFQSAGFKRLHVVDLEGARSGSGHNRQMIRDVIDAVGIPVQVGGGIRSSEDVSELLDWGAQYLILGTVVLREPERVTRWVEKWSPSAFIISLDFKGKKLHSQGWMEQSSVELKKALDRICRWGIAQVICTDIERDGTLKQPNYSTYIELVPQLTRELTLIAAGGISRLEHISRLEKIGVKGVVVGRALYEGQIAWEKLVHAG